MDKLMRRGVFIFAAQVYRTQKIENIIREEMRKSAAKNTYASFASQKSFGWETGRWESVDDLYKLKDRQSRELALGPTHEEVITDIIRKHSFHIKICHCFISNSNQVRDELRSKSGLLRGREFIMKDLYSFHTGEEDRKNIMKRSKGVFKIF